MIEFPALRLPGNPTGISTLGKRVSWSASQNYLGPYITRSELLGWHDHRGVVCDEDVNYWLPDPEDLRPEPSADRMMPVYLRDGLELMVVLPAYEVHKVEPVDVHSGNLPVDADRYQLVQGLMVGCPRCHDYGCGTLSQCFPELGGATISW